MEVNMNCSDSQKLVRFINTTNYTYNAHEQKNILVEFLVDPKVTVALGKDWVAIFPKVSNLESPIKKDLLDQMVTFEHVMQRPVNKEERKYHLNFSLRGSKNLQFGLEYKFVYCNVDFEILGVSEAFSIFQPSAESEFLQQNFIDSCTEKKSRNQKNSTDKWNQKATRKSREVVTLQEDGPEVDSGMQSVTEVRSYNVGCSNRSKQNNWGFNQVNSTSFQQSALSPRCLPGNNSCVNCSRVGSLLSSQSDLYMQVKNLAEEKLTLIQRVNCLEKQVELGQAAYQKQSVVLLQERECRINFQREVELLKNYQPVYFVYSSIFFGFDSYRRPLYSVFPVMFFSRIPVQEEYMCATPNSLPKAEKKPGWLNYPANKWLKAMAGHQEEKIRSLNERLIKKEQQVQFLTDKLAELQAENICKVKVVEKEVEGTEKKMWSETQSYNNNEGEETGDID